MSLSEHTIQTPGWISALVEDVLVGCVLPLGFAGPIGYRYWPPDDQTNPSAAWLIVAYPTPSVVRGQDAADGAVFVSGFRFDVATLIKAMGDVSEVVWCSPAGSGNNLDGPEISVRGTFLGKDVWIRFFSLPPPDEPPAYAVDPRTGEATELPA